MCGEVILPFVVREPILEIDYAETIPLVEQALLKLERGEWPEAEQKKRHAA
ncbi:MAG: hypothetical protein M1281_03720 [Chloroflexi bacterium]|nr:hypothetical protein [Chloroflexota bacterium]